MEEQKVVIPEPKQEQRLSVGDGFIGMFNAFVDPAGLAKRVPAPLSWLWPVITLIIIYVVFGYLMLPYTLSVVDLAINQQIREQNTRLSRPSGRPTSRTRSTNSFQWPALCLSSCSCCCLPGW